MRTKTIRNIDEWLHTAMGHPLESNTLTLADCKALIHTADIPRVLVTFYQYLNGKSPYFEDEFRIRHQDGNWKRVAACGTIIERDEHGLPLRVIGTIAVIPS